MTSFKSGSGNLDFGGGGTEESEETTEESRSSSSEERRDATRSEPATDDASPRTESSNAGSETATSETYPYFVRRSNVTDERDQRIEVHLRKEIFGQESSFRNELAEHLETDEISKTDAREFALKFAFQHPEGVAELMRDEGFGILD